MVGAFTAGRGKLAVSFKKGSEGFCTMGGKIEGRFCALISCDKPEQFPVGGGRDDSVSIWWGRTGLVPFWWGCGCRVCFGFCVFPKAGAVSSFSIVRLRRGFFAAAEKGTCRFRRTGFFCSLDPLGFLCAAGYRFSMLFDSLSMR